VETNRFIPSAARHREVVGQDTAPKDEVLLSTCFTFQVACPPVGLVEVATFPPLSKPTHRLAEAQDRPASGPSRPLRWVVAHAPAWRLGFVDVKIAPPARAQKRTEGQETVLIIALVWLRRVAAQAREPPLGRVESIKSDRSEVWTVPVARQKVVAGHDKSVICPCPVGYGAW
jgi:hypothetical protein